MDFGDIGAYIVSALGYLARWLEAAASPWPWPIPMAGAAIILLGLTTFGWWLAAGMFIPTLCKYSPTTKRKGKDGACRRRTLGEWRYCWNHNSRWKTVGTHHVDPRQPKWMRWDSAMGWIEREGIRASKGRSSLLFYRGYARSPRQVVAAWPEAWKRWTELVATLRQRFGRSGNIPATESGVTSVAAPVITDEERAKYPAIANRSRCANEALNVLRFLLPAGLVVGGATAFLDGPASLVVSYAGLLLLWAAFRIVQVGMWKAPESGHWVRETAKQVLIDFAVFVAGAVALYFISTVVMPYIAVALAV